MNGDRTAPGHHGRIGQLTAVRNASEANKFYLKVPGVRGDSTAPGHHGYIELLTAVYSVSGMRVAILPSDLPVVNRPQLFLGLSVEAKQGSHSVSFRRASETEAKFDTAHVSELTFEKGRLVSTSGHQLSGVSVTLVSTRTRRTPAGAVEVVEGYFLGFDEHPVPGSAEQYEARAWREMAEKKRGVL